MFYEVFIKRVNGLLCSLLIFFGFLLHKIVFVVFLILIVCAQAITVKIGGKLNLEPVIVFVAKIEAAAKVTLVTVLIMVKNTV